MLDTLPELNQASVPASLEAEAQVLACCLREPELVDEAATSLLPEDFYDLRHRNLFELMLKLRSTGKPVDASVCIQESKNLRGGTESVGGIAYLAGLPDRVPSPALITYSTGVVRHKAQLRQWQESAHYILSTVNAEGIGDDERLDEIGTHLSPLIHADRKGGEASVRDVVKAAIGEIEQAFEHKGKCTGIRTGFPALDKLTAGLQRGDMLILAARPSMGKTSLAMNIAEHVALDDGVPVGFLSLEMNDTSLIKRLLSSRANINGHDLLNGNLSEKDIHALTSVAAKVAAAPIHINDKPALSVLEVGAAMRRMVNKHGCKLIVLDYLQLVQAKAENQTQRIAKVSSAVKASAKELGVPVLALSQLSRAAATEDRKPQLSDLRDSGAIEQDADLVMFLSRERDATMTQLDVAKHRNGPVGIVELEWDASRTRYRNPVYWMKNHAQVDAT